MCGICSDDRLATARFDDTQAHLTKRPSWKLLGYLSFSVYMISIPIIYGAAKQPQPIRPPGNFPIGNGIKITAEIVKNFTTRNDDFQWALLGCSTFAW